MTGDDYDLMLHCTIGHMHRVDGAEPDFEDGEKTLNLLAPLTQPRCIFCIFVILCIFCIFLTYTACRHVLRESQPIYGFWYYFMIHRGIGLSLQKILPRFVPRSDAEVDALLDCKLRVYVLHILNILHILHILNIECLSG